MASRSPCKQCPFRRNALPGYLGDDTPEHFIETSLADVRMPCHKTIDYTDPTWRQKWERRSTGRECAGNATFYANISKLSRDRTRERAQPDHATVFSSPQEFLKHHLQSMEEWTRNVLAKIKGKQDGVDHTAATHTAARTPASAPRRKHRLPQPTG